MKGRPARIRAATIDDTRQSSAHVPVLDRNITIGPVAVCDVTIRPDMIAECDDVGTGYSSLAYLQRLPVDTLKIDRSFISTMADSPESGALIRTFVQLGKTLGLETLAEGIEESAHSQLEREQCDSGQGYLYARPLEADAVEAFLTVRSGTDMARSARTEILHNP